jgi:hypothetical protein
MPEATEAQQRKLNEQLYITQNLLKDIAQGYNKVVQNTRPVLDGSAAMLKEAQASFDIASKKEGLTKDEAKQLGYTGARLEMIEETYKHITDNVEGIIAGTVEADPFNLAGQADMIKNGLAAMTDEIRDSYDYAIGLQKALSDPKTGKVFANIDKGASKIESMIGSLPGGNFLGEQFNLTGPEGSIQKMSGELKGDFIKSIGKGGKGMGGILKSTKLLKLGFAAVAVAAAGFALEVNKAQRDLGTSFAQTSKILATSKAVAAVNKLNGMTQEDTLQIIKGIASEFGSFSDATTSATLQASNLVANFGLSADSVGTLARNMQAVGEGSLESALNSIELQANMARAADVPVADVMNDVAKNTDLFARFAKDGGANVTAAAIAAKKLGLELSNVASIADSLLNFEDSITKQMEAEVLLGRELNLEKAREMVFNNDIAGAMGEISRLVSAEEWEAMDAVRRGALAAAVGLDAAAMAKAVSGGGAGGGVTSTMRTGGAPAGGGGKDKMDMLITTVQEGNHNMVRAVQNQGVA